MRRKRKTVYCDYCDTFVNESENGRNQHARGAHHREAVFTWYASLARGQAPVHPSRVGEKGPQIALEDYGIDLGRRLDRFQRDTFPNTYPPRPPGGAPAMGRPGARPGPMPGHGMPMPMGMPMGMHGRPPMPGPMGAGYGMPRPFVTGPGAPAGPFSGRPPMPGAMGLHPTGSARPGPGAGASVPPAPPAPGAPPTGIPASMPGSSSASSAAAGATKPGTGPEGGTAQAGSAAMGSLTGGAGLASLTGGTGLSALAGGSGEGGAPASVPMS